MSAYFMAFTKLLTFFKQFLHCVTLLLEK